MVGVKGLCHEGDDMLGGAEEREPDAEEVFGDHGFGNLEALDGVGADMGQVIANAFDVFHAAVQMLQKKRLAAGEVAVGELPEIVVHGLADIVEDFFVGQQFAIDLPGGREDQFTVKQHVFHADLRHAAQFAHDCRQRLFLSLIHI